MPPNIENGEQIYTIDVPSELKEKCDGDKRTVDEVIDTIGNGKAQWLVLTAMTLCLAANMMEAMGVSFMVPAATCDLELDTFRIGVWISTFFLGIMLTQHLWGFIADVRGRKFVLGISVFLGIAFSLPTAIAPSFWIMVPLRLLTGMSFAGSSAIIYVFLGEFYTEKGRASAIILMSSFTGLGAILMPGVAWLLSYQDFSFQITDSFQMNPWRFQIIIQLIPAIVCLILIKFLPESPRFLASVQKEKEAIESLRWIYEKNTGKPGSELIIKGLVLPEVDENETKHSKKTLTGFCYFIVHETAVLFRPPHVVLLLKCCYIQFCLFLVGVGMGMWFPELTNRISNQNEAELTVCQIIQSTYQQTQIPDFNSTLSEVDEECKVVINDQTFIANMILGLFYYIGFNILAVITKKVHKNYITGTLLLLSGFSGIILYWITEVNGILGVFVFLLVFSGLPIGMLATIVVDLFPTHLRGMAFSLVNLSGRTATFTGANIIGFLLESNCQVTFFCLAALVLIASCLAWTLPKQGVKH